MTNLEYFESRPAMDAEFSRRFKALKNQILQLQAYHIKAKPSKREIIRRILYTYESAYEQIIAKLDKRSV